MSRVLRVVEVRLVVSVDAAEGSPVGWLTAGGIHALVELPHVVAAVQLYADGYGHLTPDMRTVEIAGDTDRAGRVVAFDSLRFGEVRS